MSAKHFSRYCLISHQCGPHQSSMTDFDPVLYLKLAASEIRSPQAKQKQKMSLRLLLIIVVPVVITVLSIIAILYFCIMRRKKTDGNPSYTSFIDYGYMAPEYAMHGKFSVKSDVFSFGVLILEILCGKRSNSFGKGEDAESILTYAWKLWNEGKHLELLDSTLRENHSTNEVMRCIEIALLCVQESVAERPTMARIVHILNNYSVTLGAPLKPSAFSLRSNTKKEANIPSQDANNVSVNEVSITALYPR
ncbi:hypothetical protein MKW92_022654 [Papaver armeniacum]|nr:hypothetical protein MKW92_022654 [Papaver armeniacum]